MSVDFSNQLHTNHLEWHGTNCFWFRWAWVERERSWYLNPGGEIWNDGVAPTKFTSIWALWREYVWFGEAEADVEKEASGKDEAELNSWDRQRRKAKSRRAGAFILNPDLWIAMTQLLQGRKSKEDPLFSRCREFYTVMQPGPWSWVTTSFSLLTYRRNLESLGWGRTAGRGDVL